MKPHERPLGSWAFFSPLLEVIAARAMMLCQCFGHTSFPNAAEVGVPLAGTAVM